MTTFDLIRVLLAGWREVRLPLLRLRLLDLLLRPDIVRKVHCGHKPTETEF